MNILNGNEAFAAMMAGRNILCRAVGEMLDFDNIDQFPATIFAKPGYEFCIKIETMELAGITFTKPLTLDDVVEGQEIFMVHPDHISQIKYSEQCGEYFAGVRNGFAQANQENAELQLQAIGELFGRVICYPPTIDNTGKTKKRRSRKSKEDEQEETIDLEKMFETILSNIAVSTTEQEVLQSCFSLYQYGFSDDLVAAIENAKTSRLTELDEQYFDETDPAVQKFIEAIEKCQSDYELQGVERNLEGNKGKLHESEYEELSKRISAKRESFFPASPKTQPVDTLNVDELRKLQEEAEKLIQSQKDAPLEQPVQADEDAVYKELLADLLDRVAKSISPMEANAQIKYTKSWTEEQRKPLIDAINKRLIELNPPNVQPSLAVRIQRAEDLTELDALEIDVSACDEEIQPRLMELVEKRRLELDPFTAAIGEP